MNPKNCHHAWHVVSSIPLIELVSRTYRQLNTLRCAVCNAERSEVVKPILESHFKEPF